MSVSFNSQIGFSAKRNGLDQKILQDLTKRLPDYKKMLQKPELTSLLDGIKSKISACNDPNDILLLRKQEGIYERALEKLNKGEILGKSVMPNYPPFCGNLDRMA